MKSDRENTTSIKKLFLMGDEATSRISKDFHAFDHRNSFVHIEVDMLTKHEFSVKSKVQVLPSILRA